MATITEAIAAVRRHIDGEGDTERWTDAQIKSALAYALQKCLEEYVANGGRRLEEIIQVNTASTGVYAFPSDYPLVIKGVSFVSGTRRWPLQAVAYEDQRAQVANVQAIEIRYTPNLSLSATDGHPLVGNGATAKNTWLSFEEWIIVTAAMYASVIDDELRPVLQDLEGRLQSAVMKQMSIPMALPFPNAPSGYSALYGYIYEPATKSIKLVRRFG
jgi:hypothetical protein